MIKICCISRNKREFKDWLAPVQTIRPDWASPGAAGCWEFFISDFCKHQGIFQMGHFNGTHFPACLLQQLGGSRSAEVENTLLRLTRARSCRRSNTQLVPLMLLAEPTEGFLDPISDPPWPLLSSRPRPCPPVHGQAISRTRTWWISSAKMIQKSCLPISVRSVTAASEPFTL